MSATPPREDEIVCESVVSVHVVYVPRHEVRYVLMGETEEDSFVRGDEYELRVRTYRAGQLRDTTPRCGRCAVTRDFVDDTPAEALRKIVEVLSLHLVEEIARHIEEHGARVTERGDDDTHAHP